MYITEDCATLMRFFFMVHSEMELPEDMLDEKYSALVYDIFV